MWIQIALVFFTRAVFAVPFYDSYDDMYNFQDAEMKIESVEEMDRLRGRRFENSLASNLTMAPEDAAAVEGAIHELLGRMQPEYVAPTSPRRTPEPDPKLNHVSTNTTRTQQPSPYIHEYSTILTRTPNSNQVFKHNHPTTPTRNTPSQAPILERIATNPTRTIISGEEFHKYTTLTTPSRSSKPSTVVSGYIVASRTSEAEASGRSLVFVDYTIPTRTLFPLTPGGELVTRTSPRQSYPKVQAQLVDYKFKATKMPLRTQIATMQTMTKKYPSRTKSGQEFHQYMTLTTPSRSSKPGNNLPGYIAARTNQALELNESIPIALRWKPRRTRKTTKSTTTRNTLCTDKPAQCKTMCFDEDKYRVPCPTTTQGTTLPRLDMKRLFGILSNFIEEYDTNLTERFNTSLLKSYASCGPTRTTTLDTATTVEQTSALYDYEASNKTGAVIAKCFVCGLELEGIPRNAHCSDAFAGEFLPLTPVDASARGHLAEFRKYCKYMDMLPWYINGTDSRSIWGAWSGGCSVRWLDLSGVYTQRACRSRRRPAVGRHFVSKRMAKLELALGAVDNGCIISPMASLVPFARGVSLYARFHACVCTGNWCNRAATLCYDSFLSFLIAPLVFSIMLCSV